MEESKKDAEKFHGAPISKEDINQKFLRSLPPSWNQIALIMRNKPDIDEIYIDDLYNNFKVYKDEMKSGRFLRLVPAGGTSQVPSTPCAHDIDEDDLEELDLRWQVAMLTVRVKKSNAPTNESSSQALVAQDGLGGYDWSNDFEIELVNYALMVISSSSSSSSSDNEVQKCSKQCLESFKTLQKNLIQKREKYSRARLEIQGYELALESLDSRILGHEKNELVWGENMRVLTKTGLTIPVKQNEKRAVHTVSTARPIQTSLLFVQQSIDLLQDQAMWIWFFCSSHMTGNKAYLSDYEDFNKGFMAFGSDPKGGKITSKGKIKTANLDFDDFKLLDESHVVLRAPRKDDVYSLDLKNIVPFRAEMVVAERKNMTLIEAARTMLADSLLPIPFWAEAVKSTCNVPIVKSLEAYNKRTKRVEENLHINFLEDQPNVTGTGPNWMFDLDFLTNSMNYIPVSVENQVNVDACTQDSYVAGSSGKDKGPTQEYILLPLQPHRTRIPVEDVPPAAHEKPSESSPKDNDVQDTEDAADKEEQHQMKESEQDLQDELEKMVTQELAAKAMDDVSRQAFEEEKRRIASQKKAAQATSTNILSTDRPSVSTDRPSVSTDRPFVSTDRPSVSIASTPTGTNAGESSFVYP
ncbi:hypothetical protein Tco_0493446 [Tanacetum coccineum]